MDNLLPKFRKDLYWVYGINDRMSRPPQNLTKALILEQHSDQWQRQVMQTQQGAYLVVSH